MSAWAEPGVKCVCVGDFSNLAAEFGFECPTVGMTYIVRDVILRLGPNGGVGLLLEEVVNSPHLLTNGDIAEIAFDVCDFRPLVSQGQDIALFAHHLDRLGEPA